MASEEERLYLFQFQKSPWMLSWAEFYSYKKTSGEDLLQLGGQRVTCYTPLLYIYDYNPRLYYGVINLSENSWLQLPVRSFMVLIH